VSRTWAAMKSWLNRLQSLFISLPFCWEYWRVVAWKVEVCFF
jgi:hypothetical protein